MTKYTLAEHTDLGVTLRKMRERLGRMTEDQVTRRIKLKITCKNCGGYPEPFMLDDSVWAEVHPQGKQGFLCLHCVGDKLGRPLEATDFTNAIINLPVLVGMQIGQRMGAQRCDS